MLPHVLHSATRAAAVVQNQTHTLRNVLQLQSPSSGTGSNWGNGPGPGGSKFNPGSRYHSTYNGAGRAVTQANVITSQDGQNNYSDDTEEASPRKSRTIISTPSKRPRMRSSSVSMGVAGRTERGETLGVLQTVQLHARSKGVFAPVETLAAAKQRLLADPVSVFDDVDDIPSRPLLVRRNSTSAPLSPLLDASPPPPLPTPPPEPLDGPRRKSSVSATTEKSSQPEPFTEPSQTATPPSSPEDPSASYTRRLRELAKSEDSKAVNDYIRFVLLKLEKPPVEVFNAALYAISRTRAEGEPLNSIIRLYNTMLDKDVLPNVQTYEPLIFAFTTRDVEVHRAINSLELRLKQRPLLERFETSSAQNDKNRIITLREENNFAQAMTLFESIRALGQSSELPSFLFVRLLRSCAIHSNVDSAIHVFAQLESSKARLDIAAYRYLILTFSNAKRIQEAEEIFRDFIKNSKDNKIALSGSPLNVRYHQLLVWNTMIEAYFRADMPDKAIELVDQMVRSQAGDQFTVSDVPITTSSTFTAVIAGFIHNGDVQSALTWFDKLLSQEQAPLSPFQGLGGKAMRPDAVAWGLIIDALAEHGKVEELNRLFTFLRSSHKEDGIRILPVHRQIVFAANMATMKSLDKDTAIQTLDWLGSTVIAGTRNKSLIMAVTEEYISRGQFGPAYEIFSQELFKSVEDLNAAEARSAENGVPAPDSYSLQKIQYELLSFTNALFSSAANGSGEISFPVALDVARLFTALSLKPQAMFAPYFLQSYGQAHRNSLIPFAELNVQDWNLLLDFATQYELAQANGTTQGMPVVPEFVFGGLSSLLQDIVNQGIAFESLDVEVGKHILETLQARYGDDQTAEILSKLGPSYLNAWNNLVQVRYAALESALTQEPSQMVQAESSQMAMNEYPPLAVNSYLSRSIDETLRHPGSAYANEKLYKAYAIFEKGLQKGTAPSPSSIGRLIQGLGRLNELDKVRQLYTVAQSVLSSFPSEEQQYHAWVSIEDSMIVALAHSGNIDAAHVHRLRVLENGGTPSADAYGVLIQYVRDTTDDTSGAMALFQEAMERGVRPNLYLYNNIISKLSKARKADHALELFQQMKANGVTPSSITYGTVIGACARVGDVTSAETLFQEMIHSKGFKPRVPPYNTMMQLFTTTKPLRNSVLYYYDQLVQAGIQPSAHTYKLLLDAYGSIEPVDLASMESVFTTLQNDASVPITGAHFASLINAYGCVSKDLEKAISIFESIPTFPRAPPADAVVYEALLNAIVAHKRTDLIPVYVSKMSEQGVHMTAYVANFLIKGYASVGDMERAKEIFESLVDPPTGVAAPNNHALHHGTTAGNVEGGDGQQGHVDVMEPVYREPSTWEVMVRAELGAGNRDAALDLLNRLKARQYPEAVYNRISGVLTDHSEPSAML